MSSIIEWLEAHDSLSGWAQFFGAMLAILITYFTAFAPSWKRHRQLEKAAVRLLHNSYEMVESYHRTSANFIPSARSIRSAGASFTMVAGEIDRFPVFELSNQGPHSMARRLITAAMQLKLTNMVLEDFATELDSRLGTVDDQRNIRLFVDNQLKMFEALLTGKEIKRPTWPIADSQSE